MSRWKAAAIHLALSAVVATFVFALFFLVWYPGPLFEATGGQKLLFLIVGIDVVAGPLLTLVVFKSGKPGLKMDLAAIAIAQAAFLIYGAYVAVVARPVFIVFNVDRFSVVSANALEDDDLAQAPSEALRKRSWTGPVYLAAEQPPPGPELDALIQSAARGRDIDMYPKYYRPYADFAPAIAAAAKPLAELAARGPAEKVAVDALLAAREDDADLAWLPVSARVRSLTAIVSKSTGAVLDILPIEPWAAPEKRP